MKSIRKYLINHKLLFALAFFVFVTANIFLTIAGSDIYYLSIVPIYIVFSYVTGLKSGLTFIFCIFLLFILYIQYIAFGPIPSTENTAVWFVLFFASGIIKKWKE